jgi:signal transduction histidine kinase
VKYTLPGGAVTVLVQQVYGQAQVEVADTGIGIPEEALPHLFEEFYRAPNAKKLDEVGTGLGLAIVKDLVERYGGRIQVQSVINQGTTFTVTFPLVS